jgi:formylglycine-generating enzyme required for sulfatase activity
MPTVSTPELSVVLVILLILPGGGKVREVLRGLSSAICGIVRRTESEKEGPGRESASGQRLRVRRRSLKPDVVCIPAGRFWMGTDRLALESAGVTWRAWMQDETPYHEIYLPEYQIGRYPVTNAEFTRFIEDGGYQNRDCWTDAGWRNKEGKGWTQPRRWDDDRYNGPSQPVVGVSWYEALAYCHWLAASTGIPYRLPSEAEWEKAARGTDGRLWPWGNEWCPDRCNTAERYAGQTTPVGGHSSVADSPYGVADVAGNVWEWTISLWGRWMGRKAELQFRYPYDPDDGREDLEAGADMLRVVRGGSFFYDRNFARCACRFWYNPHFVWCSFGFRVAVNPDPGESLPVL